MNFSLKKYYKGMLSALVLGMVFFIPFFQANAAGGVDATNKYSQFRDLDLNDDGTNDRINWKPSNGTAVSFQDGAVTGQIWGESVGWINLDPSTGGVSLTCSGTTGTFSGYAWGENTGWINFAPTNGGLSMNATGELSGDVWSENFGWINFACPGGNTCVESEFLCTTSTPPNPDPPDITGSYPGTCQIEAFPASVTPGQSTTLSWSSTTFNATNFQSGSISPIVGSIAGPSGTVVVQPNATTRYRLNLQGSGYTDATCSVEVPFIPDPVTASYVEFTSPIFYGSEDTRLAEVYVKRTGNLSQAGAVSVSIDDITATAGLDYVRRTQTVTWNANDGSQKKVSFVIIDDTIPEPVERARLSLGSFINVVPGNQMNTGLTSAVLEISDNDINPLDVGEIRFVSPLYQVNENGGTVTVEVARVGGSFGPASVDFDTPPGTASDLTDYQRRAGVIEWLDGEMSTIALDVTIADDLIPEPTEVFYGVLSLVQGARLGNPSRVEIEIFDNDEPPVLVGCLDPNASNYDPSVTQNDASSCLYSDTDIFGCMDSEALNFNPNATMPNQSCVYEYGEEDSGGGILGGGGLPEQLLQALALLGLVTTLPSVLLRGWNLLLAFLGFRKKHRPWGTVYDAVTKQPLDPAYVTLHNEAGEEVASAITDLDGRYGFLVEPGVYTVRAQKTHYAFPSRMMTGKTKDDLYANLYFGERFEVTKDSQVVTRNIPMDPQSVDWNEKEKVNMGNVFSFFSRHDRLFVKIINTFFWFGFAFSIVALILSPVVWNIVIVALYIALFILSLFGITSIVPGIVKNGQGKSLPFAVIRVFNARLNKEVAHKVANQYGHYYLLIKKGEYYLTVEKKESDGSYTHVYTSNTFKVRRGVINKFIKTG